ncbi:putative family helicase [Diplodia seriata]|uniref:ATP-dependent DNA helicase n=1 Tax=Diplodia seriata TaxID=420778 RepID=A0A0G2G8X0_9PEZI|nr:putative family helicase [Diplodia seriata]
MALTATATENVKVDTIHNLGIEGCEVFAQSFNRPNLYYDVRTKGKREDILQNIADIIKTNYRGQSGIVYCLARKKCELIAEQLRVKHGISAQHYHAGMEPAQKSETQKAWQSGTYKVIVATIAFGMGIDKPDVRFVIHHSIPKSLEGYYQETGRAGRDGKRSGCHLFYGYQDTAILKKMIDEGEGSRQQKERQYAMLRNVVQFCENKADCRRVQVLAYFNEAFKADECDAECDNCNSTITFENRDFTDLAAAAINLVGRIQTQNVTLLHCVDVFRGSSSKKIKELGHDSLTEYGSGSELDRGDAERLFQRLVSEDALAEDNHINRAGFTSQYIKLGRNCRIFQARKKPVQIHVRVSPRQSKGKKTKNAATKRKGTGVAAARDEYPFSTNVSSPLQMASRASRKARVVDMEDDDDGFGEPVDAEAEDESEAFEAPPQPRSRIVAKSSKHPRQKLGAPITTDEKMVALDELHQDVVEEFVREGRSECQKILIGRNLRSHPFTDTVLREMAISFPETQKELMNIPGADAQMVTLYGERFLRLVKRYKNNFESMTGQHLQQADKVKDPNHEIIEISDEDEEDDDAAFEDELDLDAEESSDECRSSYFNPQEADPDRHQ